MPEENINIVIAHYTFLDRISGVNIVMADLAQGLCEIAGTKKPIVLSFDATPGEFEFFRTEILKRYDNTEETARSVSEELGRIPKPSVLLCHNFHIPLFFESIAQPVIRGAVASGTPVINVIHDYSSNDIGTTRWVADMGVELSAVSGKVRDEVTGHGFRCDLVKNSINTQKFRRNDVSRQQIRKQLNIDEGTILLGSYARAVPRKQFPVLVEAFADILPRTDRELVLYIRAIPSTVEPGKTDVIIQEIQEAVERRGISERVILETNPIPWETSLSPYFNAADLLVYPSINEGFGLQLPEAIATSTPYISSDIPCYTEITEKVVPDLMGNILFKAGDRGALSDAMVAALENIFFLKQEMIKGREKVVRFYGLQNMVNGYLELFRKVK